MKFLSTLLVAALAGPNNAATVMETVTFKDDLNFPGFLERFGVDVSDDDYEAREAIFRSNVERIHAHNANPDKSWTMGINQFTHLTEKEFEYQLVRGYNKRVARQLSATEQSRMAPLESHIDESRLPKSVDFRKARPAVLTPVKNQGACGSCWYELAT